MKAKVSLSIMAFLILICTPAISETIADVLVQPAAKVSGIETKLSDIASVQTNDKALKEKLDDAVVCRSPLPGSVRKLTRDQIRTAIRRQGVADNAANLVSPKEVMIARASAKITGQALFDVVQQYILSNCSWTGSVSVEPVRIPSDLNIPVGDIELRVKQGGQKIKKGRGNLPVEVIVDGSVYTTLHVSFNVKVYGPVLIAVKTINKSEEVNLSNTTLNEQEITSLPDDIVAEAPGPDTIAAIAISEGSMIRRSWLTTPPLIKSGEAVTVRVCGRYVTISDKGSAVTDGRLGDKIKIRLGSDAREVRAEVKAPGLVEINISKRS